MTSRLVQFFAKLFSRQRDDARNLYESACLIDDAGLDFRMRDGLLVPGFYWSEVTRIETYKLDLLTYDEVALLFTTADGCFEILESQTGFKDCFAQLEQQFGLSPEWYFQVMEHAFETNHRVLYQKENIRSN
ncbi:hypothetical protein Pan153_38710 [Gimesia panareensis]|uniref:Uncharacterized protein n=1 Tax=Gimesia panareensis TaxID=2527978 RepID=A0A518FS80_9PLAN|nr:hypothetical protein [Gimesia panareensis]QDV19206.1 hypothetical protein Pan153_38710 [Gimesia panareensis]